MIKSMIMVVCAFALLLTCSSAFALGFSDVTVTDTAGSGDNSAMCVIDFGSGNSFAFQYFWEDSATSQMMLEDLAASTGLSVVIDFGFVNSISYGGFSIVNDADWDNYTGGYPSFWWSGYDAYSYEDFFSGDIVNVPGEQPNGGTWGYAGLGVADRILQDGYWDGWTYALASGGSAAPVVPVPEPVSATLLAVGAVSLIRRRREK